MKLDPYLTPYTENNSKRIKDLNVRTKIVRLFEGNIGGKFDDIGFDSDFLDMTPKAQAAKINK